MKIHMHCEPLTNHPHAVSCDWNENNTLAKTNNPEEVTCRRCLNDMAGSFRAFGKYAEFFNKHPELQHRKDWP